MRGVSPGDKVMFYPGVWLLINCLYGLTTGYCLYGDDPECAFQCHCAVDSECSGVTCPSGCDTAPLGHNWRGPACQIGNVGLHKPANMTADIEYNRFYPPTAALDGVSPSYTTTNCAHTSAPGNNPAEWWTDLGDVYKIYNITIYGSNDKKLQQFELTVYNTSDNEVLCGQHRDPVLTNSTITCIEPVIGRYVHFKKIRGPDITWTPICEVVIIGHKYIDCTHCPDGITCDDITGCTQCSGSYPPDCKTKCESGYYGTNCRQHCGHCKDGVTCDNQNGKCSNGCQMWWADDRCNTFIEKPNGAGKSVSVKQKSESSIEIEWQHVGGISDDLNQYYGYLIQYKEETTGASYREAATVNSTSSLYWKIDKLKGYTSYSIQIKPFRMFDGQKDYGSAYPVLQVMTNCGDPESPNLTVVVAQSSGLLSHSIIIFVYEPLSGLGPSCVRVTRAFIEYRRLGTENWLKESICNLSSVTYTMLFDGVSGRYEVRLKIYSKDGMSSSSNVRYVEVPDLEAVRNENTDSTSLPIYVMAVIIAISVIINITLVIIIWKCRRQQEKQKSSTVLLNAAATEQNTAASLPGQSTEGSKVKIELSAQTAEYEVIAQNASTNQHNQHVGPALRDRNDGVAQYEDILGKVTVAKSQDLYEGLSDEARAIYENRTMTGPYAELKK